MKINWIALNAVVFLASTGFCALNVDQQTLQNDAVVVSQGNISVTDKGQTSRLTSAAVDQQNPANVVFSLADGSQVLAVFHNPTEADWFMQFLAQADQSYGMTITKKGLLGGGSPINEVGGLRSGGANSVNFFKVETQDSISLKILVKNANSASVTSCTSEAYINGDVIIDGQGDNPNMVPQVTIAPAGVTLDAFTDLIRGALGNQGYFFGAEGQKDEQKSQFCSNN